MASAASLLADLPHHPAHWMGADELQRLGSITSPRRRLHFLGGHWLLRCLAAEVMGGTAQDWQVTTSTDGVPGLQAMHAMQADPVFASISHSGPWLAAAIGREPLGIDLECPQRLRDLDGLAQLAFPPIECARLAALEADQREAYFYLHWTIREASAKHAGFGLQLEQARRQVTRECAAGEAQLFSWEFPGGVLSLSTAAGTQVVPSGLPTGAHLGYRRLDSQHS